MHVHMSMCVTRIPSAGGFACPGDGVETARSRTTCSCWTYVREPVLKSAAVLCRGRGLGMGMAGGVGLSAVRASARRPSLRPSTVVRRAARSCAVWRVAQRLPTALRPPAKHSRRAHGGPPPPATTPPPPLAPRPGLTLRPGAAAPTPGAYRKQYSCKNGPGSFLFRGDHRSAHAPASLFDARQRLRTRTSAVAAVSSVSHSISRCHLASGSAVLQCSSSREPVPHTVAEALGAPQTSQHTSPCCPVAAASAARPASDAC